jgi:hypothetical protein
MGKHQRHGQDAGTEREHVRGFAQIKAADATRALPLQRDAS